MNKLLKVMAMGGLVAMSLGLSGCQNGGPAAPKATDKAPEVVLQEGIEKLSDVTAFNFAVNVNGDLKGPINPETGEVDAPENVKFNLNVNGGADMKVAADPRLNLNVKGDMMADQDGGNAEFSFRFNKDAFFFNLAKLEGKGQMMIPEEMVSAYIGKWWTFPVPPEALAELSKSVPQSADENLTPEQKKIKELLQTTKFFKDVKYVGDENVGSESSAHYTASLDKAAFVGFVEKAAAIQGETLSESDKTELNTGLNMFEFSGDMYVGKTSGALNKVKGTLTVKGDGKTPAPTGKVSLDISLTDLNKPVTVEVPKDAQPMPEELMSGLL